MKPDLEWVLLLCESVSGAIVVADQIPIGAFYFDLLVFNQTVYKGRKILNSAVTTWNCYKSTELTKF